MLRVISRRDFIKTSSAAGVAAAVQPFAVNAAPTSGTKSRVVIATDTTAVNGSSPVTDKINALVDHAIMTLTGKSDRAAAYEALFPEAVTTSTKILVKRNDASGKGAVNTAVTNAFKSGLTSMLGGKFPAANITTQLANMDGSKNTAAANYIINCPVAWEHIMPTNNYGVTLSLKNTMTYLGNPSALHNDTTHAWLWNNSLDPKIKPKQILSLMDAVVGSAKDGPGTSPSFAAGTIIVSKDLVAVDYNTIQLMRKQTGAKLANLTQGETDLKKAEQAGLGTCTPANMEVINIAPPWGTGTINGADTVMKNLGIQVNSPSGHVEFIFAKGTSALVTVFDSMGRLVWRNTSSSGGIITWNHSTGPGSRVPPGLYLFTIACGKTTMRGTVLIRR
jgi:hypothetical protein